MKAFPLLVVSFALTRTSFAVTAIDLEAEKTLLRADGRSTSILTARVFDDRGAAVPDGTRIQFSTTLGRLDTLTAETRGGFARVTLTAADQPGVATITANLETGGAVPARRQITFSNDAQETNQGDRWLRIEKSSYIGYALNLPNNAGPYLYAEDKNKHATLTYQGIKVVAQRFIVDTNRRAMRAEGGVVVEQGGVRRTYDRFRYDFELGTGDGERIQEFKRTQVSIRMPGLIETVRERDNVLPRDSWVIADISEAKFTVVAHAVALDFNSSLQFRHAVFYIEGQKTYSAPQHIMNLRQQSLYREQLMGVGANGMWLNLPYYYNVQPRGVGTLFLRRGAPFGSSVYSQRLGWNLDLEQSYNTGSLEGQFQVLNLASKDRGMRLQHNQKLDKKTDASLFMDVVGGKDVFGSTQIGHNFSDFRVNVSAALNRYRGFTDTASGTSIAPSGDWRVQSLMETYPKLIRPKARVRYTISGAATEQRFFGSTSRTIKTQNLGTRLSADPIKLDRQLTLTQSGVVGYTWVSAPVGTSGVGSSGSSLQTTTALAQPVRWRSEALGTFQLSYDFFQTPPLFIATGPTTPTTGVPVSNRQGRQRLSASTFLSKGEKWSFSLNGSRGLDTFQSTLFTETRIALTGPWYARLRLTQAQFTSIGYRDFEYSLIRSINGREVALYYSTIARRLQLDLTGLSF